MSKTAVKTSKDTHKSAAELGGGPRPVLGLGSLLQLVHHFIVLDEVVVLLHRDLQCTPHCYWYQVGTVLRGEMTGPAQGSGMRTGQ